MLEIGNPAIDWVRLANAQGVEAVRVADLGELADHLRRADAALGRFLEELAARTPTRVLITSDHGVAALPERAAAAGSRALRVSTAEVVKALNQKIPPLPGSNQPVVAAYTEPFLYLSDDARASAGYGALLEAAVREVTRIDGILAAYPVAELVAGKLPKDETSELARASVTTAAGGDVFVVVRERSVIDPRMPGGSGTSHGSPWRYDQLVPVLFFGPGITSRSEPREVDVLRVAPTLSALLGIRPPASALLPKLPGSP